ncbi:MAG: MltA domain-containing protein [Planctomycetota bacterium]
MLRWTLVAFSLVALTACSSDPPVEEKDYWRELPPGEMALVKVTDPRLIPPFGKGFNDREAILESVDQSLGWFQKPSTKQYYPYLDVDHERAFASLVAFKEVFMRATSAEALDQEIRTRFDVYMSRGCDDKGTVLFTGYCEPIFEGSLTRDSIFRYPLYRRPKDLVSQPDGKPLGRQTKGGETVPYWTREEIECAHMLDGQNLELVYLKDKFEAYICHIQGSARILLSDGRELRVGYAGKTDRPYASVGMKLIETGKIKKEELSLRRLKQYFREHPEQVDPALSVNESYVFFTERDGGPFGSLGLKVTPYHTIATDKSVFPRGCVAFVQTTLPRHAGEASVRAAPFWGFACDQDTGGAIRSAGRTDLFMGTGPDAELLAGSTYYEGQLYYLFLKDTEPRPDLPGPPKAEGKAEKGGPAPASVKKGR